MKSRQQFPISSSGSFATTDFGVRKNAHHSKHQRKKNSNRCSSSSSSTNSSQNSKNSSDEDVDEKHEQFQRKFQECISDQTLNHDPNLPPNAQAEPKDDYWNPSNQDGKAKLLPFQKYGLAWMLNREQVQKINFNSNCNSGSVSAVGSMNSSPMLPLTVANMNAFSSSSLLTAAKSTIPSSLLPQRRERQDDDDDSDATEVEKEQNNDDDDVETVLTSTNSTDATQVEEDCAKMNNSAPSTKKKLSEEQRQQQDEASNKIKQVTHEDFTRFFWKRNIPSRPGEDVTFTHELTGENRRASDHPTLPRGGLLCDEMGLGKTMSICSLLTHPVTITANPTTTFPGGRMPESYYEKHITLIVCPASLLGNWERHCVDRMMRDKVQVVVVHSTRVRPQQMFGIIEPQFDNTARENKRTIIITTYQTLANEYKKITPPEKIYPHKFMSKPKKKKKNKKRNKVNYSESSDEDSCDSDSDSSSSSSSDSEDTSTTDDDDEEAQEQEQDRASKKSTCRVTNSMYDPNYKSPFFTFYFSRIVLDEAHMIKNAKAVQSQACRAVKGEIRWAVTGTPIQNHLRDFHTLLKFLRLIGFESNKIWKKFIMDPFGKENTEVITRLQFIIQRVCLRRTKADTFNGERLIDLPKMTVKVIPLEFSEKERRSYEDIFNSCKKKINNMKKMLFISTTKREMFMSMLVMLLRCRQFTTDYRIYVRFAEIVKEGMFEDMTDEILMRCIPDEGARERLKLVMAQSRAINDREKNSQNKNSGQNKDVIDVDAEDDEDDDSASDKAAATSTSLQPPTEKSIFDNKFLDYVDSLRALFDANDDQCPICLNLPGESAIMLDSCHHIMCESCYEETRKHFDKCQKCHSAGMEALISIQDISCLDSFLAQKEAASKNKNNNNQRNNNPTNNDDFPVKGNNNKKSSSNRNSDTKNKSNAEDSSSETHHQRSEEEQQQVIPGTKCQAVFDYVMKNVLTAGFSQKCVIFSNWPAMLQLLLDYFQYRFFSSNAPPLDQEYNTLDFDIMDQKSLKFSLLTGAQKIEDRQRAVDEFQSETNTRLMFVSMKAGGTGLTLTKAQHCIIVDPFWNPSIDKQAIMRVHRISQKNPVTVVRFLVKNSVDERIIRLQIIKQKLINVSIDAGRKIPEEDIEMMRQLEEAVKVEEEESDEDTEEVEWADPKERNKKKNKNNNKKKKEENTGGGINFAELIRLFR